MADTYKYEDLSDYEKSLTYPELIEYRKKNTPQPVYKPSPQDLEEAAKKQAQIEAQYVPPKKYKPTKAELEEAASKQAKQELQYASPYSMGLTNKKTEKVVEHPVTAGLRSGKYVQDDEGYIYEHLGNGDHTVTPLFRIDQNGNIKHIAPTNKQKKWVTQGDGGLADAPLTTRDYGDAGAAKESFKTGFDMFSKVKEIIGNTANKIAGNEDQFEFSSKNNYQRLKTEAEKAQEAALSNYTRPVESAKDRQAAKYFEIGGEVVSSLVPALGAAKAVQGANWLANVSTKAPLVGKLLQTAAPMVAGGLAASAPQHLNEFAKDNETLQQALFNTGIETTGGAVGGIFGSKAGGAVASKFLGSGFGSKVGRGAGYIVGDYIPNTAITAGQLAIQSEAGLIPKMSAEDIAKTAAIQSLLPSAMALPTAMNIARNARIGQAVRGAQEPVTTPEPVGRPNVPTEPTIVRQAPEVSILTKTPADINIHEGKKIQARAQDNPAAKAFVDSVKGLTNTIDLGSPEGLNNFKAAYETIYGKGNMPEDLNLAYQKINDALFGNAEIAVTPQVLQELRQTLPDVQIKIKGKPATKPNPLIRLAEEIYAKESIDKIGAYLKEKVPNAEQIGIDQAFKQAFPDVEIKEKEKLSSIFKKISKLAGDDDVVSYAKSRINDAYGIKGEPQAEQVLVPKEQKAIAGEPQIKPEETVVSEVKPQPEPVAEPKPITPSEAMSMKYNILKTKPEAKVSKPTAKEVPTLTKPEPAVEAPVNKFEQAEVTTPKVSQVKKVKEAPKLTIKGEPIQTMPEVIKTSPEPLKEQKTGRSKEELIARAKELGLAESHATEKAIANAERELAMKQAKAQKEENKKQSIKGLPDEVAKSYEEDSKKIEEYKKTLRNEGEEPLDDKYYYVNPKKDGKGKEVVELFDDESALDRFNIAGDKVVPSREIIYDVNDDYAKVPKENTISVMQVQRLVKNGTRQQNYAAITPDEQRLNIKTVRNDDGSYTVESATLNDKPMDFPESFRHETEMNYAVTNKVKELDATHRQAKAEINAVKAGAEKSYKNADEFKQSSAISHVARDGKKGYVKLDGDKVLDLDLYTLSDGTVQVKGAKKNNKKILDVSLDKINRYLYNNKADAKNINKVLQQYRDKYIENIAGKTSKAMNKDLPEYSRNIVKATAAPIIAFLPEDEEGKVLGVKKEHLVYAALLGTAGIYAGVLGKKYGKSFLNMGKGVKIMPPHEGVQIESYTTLNKSALEKNLWNAAFNKVHEGFPVHESGDLAGTPIATKESLAKVETEFKKAKKKSEIDNYFITGGSEGKFDYKKQLDIVSAATKSPVMRAVHRAHFKAQKVAHEVKLKYNEYKDKVKDNIKKIGKDDFSKVMEVMRDVDFITSEIHNKIKKPAIREGKIYIATHDESIKARLREKFGNKDIAQAFQTYKDVRKMIDYVSESDFKSKLQRNIGETYEEAQANLPKYETDFARLNETYTTKKREIRELLKEKRTPELTQDIRVKKQALETLYYSELQPLKQKIRQIKAADKAIQGSKDRHYLPHLRDEGNFILRMQDVNKAGGAKSKDDALRFAKNFKSKKEANKWFNDPENRKALGIVQELPNGEYIVERQQYDTDGNLVTKRGRVKSEIFENPNVKYTDAKAALARAKYWIGERDMNAVELKAKINSELDNIIAENNKLADLGENSDIDINEIQTNNKYISDLKAYIDKNATFSKGKQEALNILNRFAIPKTVLAQSRANFEGWYPSNAKDLLNYIDKIDGIVHKTGGRMINVGTLQEVNNQIDSRVANGEIDNALKYLTEYQNALTEPYVSTDDLNKFVKTAQRAGSVSSLGVLAASIKLPYKAYKLGVKSGLIESLRLGMKPKIGTMIKAGLRAPIDWTKGLSTADITPSAIKSFSNPDTRAVLKEMSHVIEELNASQVYQHESQIKSKTFDKVGQKLLAAQKASEKLINFHNAAMYVESYLKNNPISADIKNNPKLYKEKISEIAADATAFTRVTNYAPEPELRLPIEQKILKNPKWTWLKPVLTMMGPRLRDLRNNIWLYQAAFKKSIPSPMDEKKMQGRFRGAVLNSMLAATFMGAKYDLAQYLFSEGLNLGEQAIDILSGKRDDDTNLNMRDKIEKWAVEGMLENGLAKTDKEAREWFGDIRNIYEKGIDSWSAGVDLSEGESLSLPFFISRAKPTATTIGKAITGGQKEWLAAAKFFAPNLYNYYSAGRAATTGKLRSGRKSKGIGDVAREMVGGSLEDTQAREAEWSSKVPLESQQQRNDYAKRVLNNPQIGSVNGKIQEKDMANLEGLATNYAKQIREKSTEFIESDNIQKQIQDATEIVEKTINDSKFEKAVKEFMGADVIETYGNEKSDRFEKLKEAAKKKVVSYYSDLAQLNALKNYLMPLYKKQSGKSLKLGQKESDLIDWNKALKASNIKDVNKYKIKASKLTDATRAAMWALTREFRSKLKDNKTKEYQKSKEYYEEDVE